jgi:hypothetical protein
MDAKPKADIAMAISSGFRWREDNGHARAGDNKTRDCPAKPNVADAQDVEGANLVAGGHGRSGDTRHGGFPNEFRDGNGRQQAGNACHKEGGAPA